VHGVKYYESTLLVPLIEAASNDMIEMDEVIRAVIAVGDRVEVHSDERGGKVLGEVVSVSSTYIKLRAYVPMTEAIMRQFSLPPVTASIFPVASQSNVRELVATTDLIKSSIRSIINIVFIVPIQELENGMVHVTGAANIFFIRYAFNNEGRIVCVPPSLYFSHHWIQPISMRLFGALNMLSYHIKKSLFHVAESQQARKSFRLFYPREAFYYLFTQVTDGSAIKGTVRRRQRIIKYYDTLKTESTMRENDLVYLRILTAQALTNIRAILGVGVGIGCSSAKPTKYSPVQYCTINSQMNSIESSTALPAEVLRKPFNPTKCNGIDLLYIQQNSSLCCHIRFTRIVVSTAEVATSRIPAAHIVREASSAYVGAWFNHNGRTYEIININIDDQICTCDTVDEPPHVTAELPLRVVENLVDSFGS